MNKIKKHQYVCEAKKKRIVECETKCIRMRMTDKNISSKKKVTKISLITMYGFFFLFYVSSETNKRSLRRSSNGNRMNEIHDREWEPKKKEKRINKNASHWSGTWMLALLLLCEIPNDIHFATLHFTLLHFNLLLNSFFSLWQSGWFRFFACFIFRWCVCECVCFNVQLRHCFKPITKFMWKWKANKTSLIESKILPKRAKKQCVHIAYTVHTHNKCSLHI